MNTTIIVITLLSGILFGYDAGVFSNALVSIQKAFAIPTKQIGFLVAVVPLSALFSALCIGKMSDDLGRRRVLWITGLAFILGSLQCALSESVSDLLLGRFILGAAIGMSATVAPLYIVEVAQRHQRGLLVTLYLVSINIGIFLATLLSSVFVYADAWRNMLALGVVPALILLGCVGIAPESPRWLGLKGDSSLAGQVLSTLYGPKEARQTLIALKQLRSVSPASGRFALFRDLRVLLIAILMGVFSQAIGIQAIIYYLGVIFEAAGIQGRWMTTLANVLVALIFMLSAMLAARLIDHVKRRHLLLAGLGGIITSLLIITWAFHHLHDSNTMGLLVLLGCALFVTCQGMSLGPLSFLIPAEILPGRIRGIGMGVAIAAGWATNTVVVYSFPVMLHHYGPGFSFLVFLLFALLAWGWGYCAVPETQNMALESIEEEIAVY